MKFPLACSLAATAAALTLAGCGGGGGGGGFLPVAQSAAPAPAPAAAPAPAPAPAVSGDKVPDPAPAPAPDPDPVPAPAPPPAPAPKTWKDADCAHSATTLPACSTNFSDHTGLADVTTESGEDVIQLQTVAAQLSSTRSPNNDVFGNKAVYGLDFLHQVKLSEFPGISFSMKLNTGDTTSIVDTYVNYVISLTCDGTAGSWLNLVTVASKMASASAPDAKGYVTYTAAPADVKWAKTGTASFPATGTALLNGVNGTAGGALALDALIAAYPNACIYNFANPKANASNGGVTPTPAVMFNLGDSGTTTDKKAWIKDIKIGDKVVF
ncbi:hypothetical protein [Variovorax sp. GT1P44]|uniref:hypothetical protein n=1 Tax=Variovorax sp. GT1P44 TaxID=3443742 RepID=UPI003F4630C7